MLLDLITQDGLDPKRKGPDEWCSPCPACGGNDRFVIHPEKGRYWCRGCGIKGDVVQYLRDHRGMSFHQAAEYAGRTVESSFAGRQLRTPQKPDRTKVTPPPEAWVTQSGQLITEAHKALVAKPERLEWLRVNRGLTRETAERFRLGWIERDIYLDRTVWGLPDELRADGKPRKLLIPAGLLIPGPGRLRIRRMEPGKFGKYYVAPGSSNAPLTIGADHPAEQTGAVIVESELDALLLAQEIPAPLLIIATGSTSNGPNETMVTDLTRRPFALIALDADPAGGKAAWQKWMGIIPNTTRAPVPAPWGKDHTDAFLAGHDLRKWFAMALHLAGHASEPAPATDLHVEQETEAACTAPEPEQAAEPPPDQTVNGVPCGGCGSTIYRRVVGGYIFQNPDESPVDGWHCGGEHCHVKLLTGNKDVDHRQ